MGPDIKITITALVSLLVSLLNLSAIERPDGDGSLEKIPDQPKGGILREDQKEGATDRLRVLRNHCQPRRWLTLEFVEMNQAMLFECTSNLKGAFFSGP